MLITNFASGELSKSLFGRVDLQQYYSGAQKIKNFEIIPTGGIQRRTGLKRIGALHGDCKLIPFIINKDESYILELTTETTSGTTTGVMYAWRSGQEVSISNPLKVTGLPYTSVSEIKEIQYAQNYDRIILVHKNYAPYVITYESNTFSVQKITFDFTADVNIDDDYDMMMTCGGSEKPSKVSTTDGHLQFSYVNTSLVSVKKDYEAGIENAYCLVSSHLYSWNNTAGEWKDAESVYVGTDTTLFNETGKYPGAVQFFNNRLFFAATAKKPQKVWASCTPDTLEDRYYKFATYQKYVTINRSVKNPDAHIFTADILVENIGENSTVLTNVSQDFTGTASLLKDITKYYVSGDYIPAGSKITAVTANSITIDSVVNITEDQKSIAMTLQLWKTYDEATAEDYEYTCVCQDIVTSDCSFNFELASRENDAIKWLAANQYLTIGTESTVWCCPNTITALAISVECAGHYGSGELQALCVDKAVVFFAQGNMGIREQYYDTNTSGFMTNNIAVHAEQMLTESSAVDFDYVNNPYNKLVIVREDGTAVQLLYDKNNGVMAWNRIVHGEYDGTNEDGIKNCCVVRGEYQNDIVYFSVRDKTNNAYYLESLDSNDGVFLDSWQIYSDKTAYTDNAVLFNKTQNKTCMANDKPDDFIASGDVVYIGYKFESDIISLPVINNDVSGKKRIVNLTVRFMDSYKPVMKVADLPDEEFTSIAEEDLPFTGQQVITYPGTSDLDVTFELKADGVYPVNILAVNALLA